MKWQSETKQQWEDRVSTPHTRFAWLPVTCQCGTVVWLERYWRRMRFGPRTGSNPHGARWWEKRVNVTEFPNLASPDHLPKK